MNSSKQRGFGVILSYLVMASNLIIGLVYTPFLIRMLGQSEYGNYNYVSSIVSYLTLLTCGFGSAYLRFATPYRNTNDDDGIANINGLFLMLFILMGSIALCIGVIMTLNSDYILGGSLTKEELATSKILMGILVVNIFMTFPVSIFNSYIIAQQRFIFQKGLALIRTFLNPAVIVIILLNGYKAIGVAWGALLVTVVIDLTSILFCLIKLNMKFKFEKEYRKYAKDVFVFSSFLLISMVVDQINWSVDKFVLGKLCGTIVVSIYTVGATINTYYKSMGEAISNVFVPKVYEILSGDDADHRATLLMTRLGRIQFFLLTLILSGFILFGKTFIKLWVGEQYNASYYVILLLMIPVTIPEIQKIGLEIQKAKNLHKFRSIVYAIIALINIAISIPLSMNYGAIGAAFGTAITVLIGNGIVMNVYYHNTVKVDMKYFWKEVLKFIPALILCFVVGLMINHLAHPDRWITFMLCVVVYAVSYTFIMYLLGLNQFEKGYIRRIVRKIFHH